ncbi:MAG: lytic transglycosylase domain-containing protein [Clostridiales bacterium]|nr:lytic transglycosylase domain-containing protein [Clostridiales bacterium]
MFDRRKPARGQPDRPQPRYLSQYAPPPKEDPFRPAPGERDRGRNRRSGRRDQQPDQAPRANPLGWMAGLAVLGLAAVLALTFLSYSRADARLQALRGERAAQAAKHEKDIGYYVQMRRVSGYDELIRKYAQEFQVDRSFISAIIARESHYDPQAESGVGARGLMQVMKDTGEWVAQRLGVQGYSYDRLYEPELNIRFGAWYLNYLSAHFNGNPVMIASAYHAGANNVKQWALNYAADQRTLTVDQIPKDNTRDYVQKVMNAYALYYEFDSQRP